MLQMIEARGAKHPFIVLPRIRRMRPYNPARVIQQFGRRQTTTGQGDSSIFIINYNACIKIFFAKIFLHELAGHVNMKGNMNENKYKYGYVDEYKTWLQDNLRSVVNTTPQVG